MIVGLPDGLLRRALSAKCHSWAASTWLPLLKLRQQLSFVNFQSHCVALRAIFFKFRHGSHLSAGVVDHEPRKRLRMPHRLPLRFLHLVLHVCGEKIP